MEAKDLVFVAGSFVSIQIFYSEEVVDMAEQDKQQIGDGQTNYAEAAKQTAKAVKEAGKAAAEKAAAAGAEAAGSATTAVVQAGVEGGKAVAEVASGTAAGGPWGAIIAAAWALRKPIFKTIIAFGLFMLILIVLIISLPSIITNNSFRTDPGSVDPDGATDLFERANDMADVVSRCIQNGYDDALARVEKIIEDNGYDYEASMDALINYGSASPDYDVCYVFAAYSASMQQRGTAEADMRNKLNAVASSMFKVTYVEKEFTRVIPLTYTTYSPVTLTVVTGKTFIGNVNGSPRYSYTTARRTYYTPSGEATTETEVEQAAYNAVTVDIPVYRNGVISGTRSETYYSADGAETLTPETEIVKYAEATIHPFNTEVINTAFEIDPAAEYPAFPGVTYAKAIETMANALKLTIYGSLTGGIPQITDEELLEILNGLNCSAVRKEIMRTALSLVGRVPYFWGGKSGPGWNDEWNKPKLVTSGGSVTSGTIRPYGLDCSGFTDWVYKTAGLGSIKAGSANQWANSTELSESELMPGDLGFKARPSDAGTNHVLIYVGVDKETGKKLWVHCSSSKGGVVLNSPSYVKYYRRPNGKDLDSNVLPGKEELGTPLYTLRVHVTHYCACKKCCGTNADGKTASGKDVVPGMVAMSSHYPFGTQLVIDGTLYTVEDRGGSGIENDITRVDIYVPDHQQALRLGRFYTEATFYRIGR